MRLYIWSIVAMVLLCGFILSEDVLASENDDHEHRYENSFSIFSLVRPLGIATLSFVFVTFLNRFVSKKIWTQICQNTLVSCDNYDNFGLNTWHIGFCLVWIRDTSN